MGKTCQPEQDTHYIPCQLDSSALHNVFDSLSEDNDNFNPWSTWNHDGNVEDGSTSLVNKECCISAIKCITLRARIHWHLLRLNVDNHTRHWVRLEPPQSTFVFSKHLQSRAWNCSGKQICKIHTIKASVHLPPAGPGAAAVAKWHHLTQQI